MGILGGVLGEGPASVGSRTILRIHSVIDTLVFLVTSDGTERNRNKLS